MGPKFRLGSYLLCYSFFSFFNSLKSVSLLAQAVPMNEDLPLCVAFDCDGVLADSVSSWKTLHDHFGTDSGELLAQYMAGEFSDAEFMSKDIALWKSKIPKIHRDDIFRAYSGCKLMKGAKEIVADLQEAGVFVAIVSAGVDLYVQSIAAMLKADDWIANGFEFDEDGWLLDEGVLRVPSKEKDTTIKRLIELIDCPPERLICVGDSSMDLSMIIPNCKFIGFNPTRDSAKEAFANAGVTVVASNDLADLRQHLGLK